MKIMRILKTFGIIINAQDNNTPISYHAALFPDGITEYDEFVATTRKALKASELPIFMQYDVAIIYPDTPEQKGCMVTYTFEHFKKLLFQL